MLSFFKKLFDYNQKELDRIQKKVNEINSLEDRARKLKDEDFIKETVKLRQELQDGKKIDDILCWSFALVREVSRRVLKERQYDVQLIAGIALHEGKVAEQKTGEGKTLSAVAPLYLNALTGKGAHLVTVNDYLARRDAGWMGYIFEKLGVTVSAIISDKSLIFNSSFTDKNATDWRLAHLKPISRKEAYQADITYGINSEFGFDYLRDNMSYSKEDLVQRGFHYAIIDEVDSVLIDEARTPHIISAPYEEDVSKYINYANLVKNLQEKDYKIDEKARTVHITEEGIRDIEKMLGVENIYEKDFETLYHIEAALKAKTLFKKDRDYIVRNNEVIIVDEFTGRLLEGRRFSEGLHQAIEAKERVNIKKESRTLATISLQNYFRMYEKLAGMTGTAATEAEELHKIYNLNVLVIPTHRPMIRKDHPDLIYKTAKGKFTALVNEIKKQHMSGRPILVGTTSIDKNEYLSDLLKKAGIPHELLNAKNHEREASIIANAGKKGAVTVATNMAGRGVDIILGGQKPNTYEKGEDKNIFEKEMKQWQKNHDDVVKLGGLIVYGTEKHESRRIDNQLRGRSGRQGDPGETRFYVSLEDDMIRIFGGEQVSNLMTFFKIPEDQPLEHAMVTRVLEQAQVKVEGFNFDIRKHLVDFDDVMNKQREIIYAMRRDMVVLDTEESYEKLKEKILKIFHDEAASLVNMSFSIDNKPDLDKIADEFSLIIGLNKEQIVRNLRVKGVEVESYLNKQIEMLFNERERMLGKNVWINLVKGIFLTTVDTFWTDHLTAIENVREGINLRGFAQLDPLVEYKNEAFNLFEKLLSDIDYEFTRRIFRVQVEKGDARVLESSMQKQEQMKEGRVMKSASMIDPFQQKKLIQQEQSRNINYQKAGTEKTEQPQEILGFKVRAPGTQSRKIGRNDSCWCGSGKKYKRCHYPN